MTTRATDQTTPEGEPRPRELARLTLLPDVNPDGDCVADFEDGRINVFGGIPGEVVDAEIVRYRRRRRQMVSAIVTEVIEPSLDRVVPPCPYFGPCSGCQWQHIDYARQLVLKRDRVLQELAAYPSLHGIYVAEAMPAPEQFGYRNHARFTVRRQGSLGFVNRITRWFTRIDECMIMTPGINDLLARLQGRAQETSQLSIRYGINTGEWLIQPTLKSPEIDMPTGQTHYRESLKGTSFRIASPSFFQVNTRQAENMVALVGELLDLKPHETLVDAYAGVGSFAVLLAPQVRRVIAIEESPSAVKDSEENQAVATNLEFVLGRTEEVLGTLERPDALILDPSRQGCHPDALDAVMRLAPGRTAYVSCDPAALARDLDILVRGGMRVASVQPVDMFPQTHHIETVALITPG